MAIMLLKDSNSRYNFCADCKRICDILLVSNTKLHPVSHCFQDSTDYWSYFSCTEDNAL